MIPLQAQHLLVRLLKARNQMPIFPPLQQGVAAEGLVNHLNKIRKNKMKLNS
jgi:hypothetical protein